MKTGLLFFLLLNQAAFAQDLSVTTLTTLPEDIYETSGLIHLDERIITHNDSGGEARLYEIDPEDGTILRSVLIANATNTDWEDICADESYIYIGDFGNNDGVRTDLKVYKISIEDYLTSLNDTVYCDTIQFSYADQVDFTPATYTTNFDAESLVAIGDSLCIFTKNWGDYQTNIYTLSKTPGEYSISKVDELTVDCLITGAGYDADKNELVLTGYTLVAPVIIYVNNFEDYAFSSGELIRFTPPLAGSIQIEGITAIGNHEFLVSSEKQGSDASTLHLIGFSNFLNEEKTSQGLPAKPSLIIDNQLLISNFEYGNEAQLIDLNGRISIQSASAQINLSHLNPGVYILIITDAGGNVLRKEKLIKPI